MDIVRTNINGLIVLQPKVYEDDRGIFFETYRDYELYSAIGRKIEFVQENQSLSYKDVFRGLHFQYGDFAQSKLIRVAHGSVMDFVIDLRPGSKTYGKSHTELVSDENRKQVFIPRGFAHGFLTLSDTAIFQYKCDNYYNKQFEGGINPSFFDNVLEGKIINERDRSFPSFSEYLNVYGKENFS